MIPLGLSDIRVARWPAVTLAIAAASVLLSLLAWLAPDNSRSDAWNRVSAYALSHPAQIVPERCSHVVTQAAAPPVPDDAGDPEPALRTAASAQFEQACLAAIHAERTGKALRWALQPSDSPTPPGAWVGHVLSWPGPLSALVGLLLLVMVVGPFMENHWGRTQFGIVTAIAAAATSLIWSKASSDASEPWSGGQGYVAALVGAFAVTFAEHPVRYWVPSWPPRQLELPGWSVAMWWVASRMLAMTLESVERPRLLAELLGLLLGGGYALMLRLQDGDGSEGARAPAVPVAVAQWWADLQQHATAWLRARGQDGVGRAPPPPESVVPAPDANWAVARAGAQPNAREPSQVLAASPEDAQWPLDVSDSDPVPAADAAVAVPIVGQFSAGSTGNEPAAFSPGQWDNAPDASAMLFDFDAPELSDFAGQGLGFSSSLPAALAQAKALNPLYAPAPDFDEGPSDALLADPSADRQDTLVVHPEALPKGLRPRPFNPIGPVLESTIAYFGHAPVAVPVLADDGIGKVAPQVRLARNVARAPDGSLRVEIDDQWENLATDLVQAVAIGLILHSNWPGARPEIWLDVILDVGGSGRPAEAVRLHLGRQALERLVPGVPLPQAFATLAEQLVAAGAFPLPQQPVWPGPPWPRFATAAEFVRMWLRQLQG